MGKLCAQAQDSGGIESHWIEVRGTDLLGGLTLDVLAVCPRPPSVLVSGAGCCQQSGRATVSGERMRCPCAPTCWSC